MQHFDSGVNQRGDDSARMSRNVGELCRDGVFFEFFVKLGGDGKTETVKRIICELAVHGERKRMPDDVPAFNRLFETLFSLLIRGAQILGNEPRADRPAVAEIACPDAVAEIFRRLDCIADEALEIFVNDIRSHIGEADVEMCFENDVDFSHLSEAFPV